MDTSREQKLREFNEELGRRLSSLDRGEWVDPAKVRTELEQKLRQRRKQQRRTGSVAPRPSPHE
jgi:hypothetical protein